MPTVWGTCAGAIVVTIRSWVFAIRSWGCPRYGQLPIPRLSRVLRDLLVAMLGWASGNSVLLVEMVRLILTGSCASLAEWPDGCAYLLVQQALDSRASCSSNRLIHWHRWWCGWCFSHLGAFLAEILELVFGGMLKVLRVYPTWKLGFPYKYLRYQDWRPGTLYALATSGSQHRYK